MNKLIGPTIKKRIKILIPIFKIFYILLKQPINLQKWEDSDFFWSPSNIS